MVPAAYTDRIRAGISYRTKGGKTMVAEGSDIVGDVSVTAADTFNIISVNPSSLTGCRVSRLAQSFSTYRPVKFEIEYVPTCGTTTPGNLVGGSVWNESLISSGFETNALITSNGGFIAPVYMKQVRRVDLKHLPQKNFATKLEHQVDSEPFVFILMVDSSATVGTVLGKAILHWAYEFENPMVTNSMEGQLPPTEVTFTTQSAAGPLEVNLDDSYSWKSVIFDSIPAALAGLLNPGERYQVVKSGADKYSLVDEENYQPIVTSASIGAGLQTLAQFAYQYLLPSIPNLLLGVRDPQASKMQRCEKTSGFQATTQIVPAQATSSGSIQSSRSSRR